MIWTGKDPPLSVRPGALRAALRPLEAEIVTNEQEMEAWTFEGGSDVRALAYQGMMGQGKGSP